MDSRLSYLESNEESYVSDYSFVNPCKNLSEVFNEEEDTGEAEHLKVFLRIRPLLSEENITSRDGNIDVLNSRNIILTAPSGSQVFKSKLQGITKVTHRFTFSHVYDQESSQKTIYDDTTQNLLREMVSGQNCLLFTYGATNSGKTYTIQGNPNNPGLLPRTLDTLFQMIGHQQYAKCDLKPQHFCGVIRMNEKEALREEEIRQKLLKLGSLSLRPSYSKSTCSLDTRLSGDSDINSVTSLSTSNLSEQTGLCDKKHENSVDKSIESADAIYAVFISFAEIYNEYIYDLLERSSFSKNQKKSPLVLGEDRNGAIYIKGLREVRVTSTEEAIKILEVGKSNLHFASTKLNHHSSRSHCIFTIKLIRLADPSYPHIARVSMLSLCDLAGAERASKTLNSMDRLKEANNINTSLLVLGRCMTALRQNQNIGKQICGPKKLVPIPYRDSKVTRIFQSFFMGKGKVALIVNISMSSVMFDETLKVLKFSALASKVSITQDKSQTADQSIYDIQSKRSSQFSRLLKKSLNMSSTSSNRLSVPWMDKSCEVTFGAGEDKENSKMVAVPEEDSEDEDEYDERYEALLQLNKQLKDKLLAMNKERYEFEVKLRKEICDNFSKRIVKIEEGWKQRIAEHEARAEDFMEWRMERLMNDDGKSKKRQRRSHDSYENEDEEMVPSIHLVREENKVRELEQEKSNMEVEIKALKMSLKATSQSAKTAQEENSKLLFQLANTNTLLKHLEEEKEKYETLKHPSEESDEKGVQDLQGKVLSLENKLSEKDSELQNVKELLLAIQKESETREHTFNSLRSSYNSTVEELTRKNMLITDLENQLSETKNMLDIQREYLEEREQEIHELMDKDSGRATNIENESQCSSPLEEDQKNLREFEAQKLQSEVAELKTKLDQLKEELCGEKDSNKELTSNLKDLSSENENLQQELEDLCKKQKSLEKDNSQLQQVVDSLDNEKILLENKFKIAVEEQITNYKASVEALETDLKELANKLGESEKKNIDKEEELISASEQVQKLTEERNNLRDDLTKVGCEKQKLIRKIEELGTCLENFKREESSTMLEKENLIMRLKQDIEDLSEQLDEWSKKNKSDEKEVENLKETLVLKEQQELGLWNEIDQIRSLLDEQEDQFKTEAETRHNEFVGMEEQLKDTIKNLEGKNSELIASLEVAKEEIQNLKNDQEGTKNLESLLLQKEGELADVKKDLHSQIQALQNKNLEKDSLISNLSSKVQNLDMKVDAAENELEINQNKCHLLEKEVAALREARTEEVKEMNDKLEEKEVALQKKEEEINTLQQELKRSLQLSVVSDASEKSKTTEMKKEKPDEDLFMLQEKVRTNEEEKSMLLLQISSLQGKISELHETIQISTASKAPEATAVDSDSRNDGSVRHEANFEKAPQRNHHQNSQTSETSEQDSTAYETPMKSVARSTRSTRIRRTRKTTQENSNYETPEGLRLTLDTSDGEDCCSVPRNTTVSSKKGRPTKNQKSSINVSTESDFKLPRSRRTKRFMNAKDSNLEFEEEEDDDYVPNTTKASSRKSTRNRGRKAASGKIYNPHLDKENDGSSLAPTDEAKSTSAANRPRRNRRPLYNLDVGEPFECSPKLIQLPQEVESPHTIVKRKLRSKAK